MPFTPNSNPPEGIDDRVMPAPITQTAIVQSDLLKAHENLAVLDSDFQATIQNLVSSQANTIKHLSALNDPLDHLITLFESLKSTGNIQQTIQMLQNLLGGYDQTLQVLYKAKEVVLEIDKSEGMNAGKVMDWRGRIADVVGQVRKVLVRQHEEGERNSEEIKTLKQRLAVVEGERNTNEKMVLSLVGKLSAAEERAAISGNEVKSLQSKLNGFKSQIAGITKWKEHVEGMGVAKELRGKASSSFSARDRALEYSKRLDVKTKFARTSRPSSRAQSKPQAAFIKTEILTTDIVEKPDKVHNDDVTNNQILGSLLDALTISKKKQTKSHLLPAESILCSKLSHMDQNLDLLLRNFSTK